MPRLFSRAAIALLLAPCPAGAETGDLRWWGEARLRGEALDGQFRPGLPTGAEGLFLRTILGAEYDAGPLRIGGEIWDSRAYFTRTRSSVSTSEVNALEPAQLYVATDFSKRARLLLGRFMLDLGSRRLTARQVFRNTTNSFTGAQLDLKSKAGDALTLFWTLPDARLPDDAQGLDDAGVVLDRARFNTQFYGGVLRTRNFGPGHIEFALFALDERDSPGLATRDRRLWTPELRYVAPPRPGKIDGELDLIWQGGKTRASALDSDRTDLPVDAWTMHAELGRSFAGRWHPRLSVAFDAASGGTGRTWRRFDQLYGAAEFDLSLSGLYAPLRRNNLLSAEARLEVKPSSRWDGYFTVRPLWLYDGRDTFAATGVIDPSGASGRDAGTQFDMRARHWLVPGHVRLATGYSHLVKGRFLREAPNAPRTGDTRFGYLELTLTR